MWLLRHFLILSSRVSASVAVMGEGTKPWTDAKNSSTGRVTFCSFFAVVPLKSLAERLATTLSFFKLVSPEEQTYLVNDTDSSQLSVVDELESLGCGLSGVGLEGQSVDNVQLLQSLNRQRSQLSRPHHVLNAGPGWGSQRIAITEEVSLGNQT